MRLYVGDEELMEIVFRLLQNTEKPKKNKVL